MMVYDFKYKLNNKKSYQTIELFKYKLNNKKSSQTIET